ncbi:MAG: hypothetical protein K2W82_09640 [Candidatus Obscuribacterales bacterium]|nr:hypothetical protein [Candidatus Obscuribacterales bacterium]
MDRNYMEQLIGKLERERTIHGEKFGKNKAHDQCLERFDKLIDQLKAECPCETNITGTDHTVKGDEFEKAEALKKQGAWLEEHHQPVKAQAVQNQARKIVAKQLNEIDGFDR